MVRTSQLYLEDICESLELILNYSKGLTEEQFLQNSLVQDAIIRRIEVIGEAANRISEEVRMKHPEIPWREIVAMRNIIVHEYFGIDLERVWFVLKEKIPELQELLKSVSR